MGLVANLGNFHRSFQNEWARYSPNVGDKLQPIISPSSLLYPRVAVEQRSHSGDEIGL